LREYSTLAKLSQFACLFRRFLGCFFFSFFFLGGEYPTEITDKSSDCPFLSLFQELGGNEQQHTHTHTLTHSLSGTHAHCCRNWAGTSSRSKNTHTHTHTLSLSLSLTHTHTLLQELGGNEQHKLRELYQNYFYNRQDQYWADEAMNKLPPLLDASSMMVCGEVRMCHVTRMNRHVTHVNESCYTCE